MTEIQWDGFDERVDADHARLDQPTETAMLERTCPTYTEHAEVRGYPGARLIILTFPDIKLTPDSAMPGVIRELPVGWRDMASPEAFHERFERTVGNYLEHGWQRVEKVA